MAIKTDKKSIAMFIVHFRNIVTCMQVERESHTPLSLFILSAIFQVNLGYPVFIEAKNDGSGGDNWSHKSCKAPVKSSPPTNRHPVFFTGRMPFLSPKQQSEHSNEIPYTNSPNSCSSTELLLLLTMY